MSCVTVITVTYNNAKGLEKTLQSLLSLKTKPLEVIIIDGESSDSTAQIVNEHLGRLNILFISERDDGIYDAMNKGRKLASGELVHYLNAGDIITGDPYHAVTAPCTYPVMLVSEDGQNLGLDKGIILGLGYNHQAVIFRKDHAPYNLEYRIAADFDLILAEFPEGVSSLTKNTRATVLYQYGGLSSVKRRERDVEILKILWERKGPLISAIFLLYASVKFIIPKKIRRIMKGQRIRWN